MFFILKRQSGKGRNSFFLNRLWEGWVPAFAAMTMMAGVANATIVIGVAGPMTGPYATFGKAMEAGAQLAVDDINANGGIDRELLVLQPADDGCTERQAQTVAQDLISKNTKMVVGHFCSYPALAAAKLYQKAGILMIAPTASLSALTDVGLTNVRRLAGRDDVQGVVAAQKIGNTEIVAVVNDGTAANVALAKNMTLARQRPPTLAITIKPDATDFESLVNDIKLKNITAIYLACSAADAAHIAVALKNANISANLYGPDALLVEQYWEIAGPAAEGTRVSFAVDPLRSIDARPVMAALKQSGIEPTEAAISAYAAVQIFAASSANKKTFNTVLGTVSFDAKGDVQQNRFMWYRWSNGKYSEE
jgi:branched-chain amino acid transport system substrate-binding protein